MPELQVDVQVPPKRRQKDPAAPQHVSTNGNGSAAAVRPERRMERRQKGPRQVWIQGTDAKGTPIEEIQIMQDYSRGGFYFVSSLHCYSVGMQLHVIPSFGSLNLEFVAEVVRVEPRRNMAYGIGVKLLHAREPIAQQKPASL
jgi:PilZ domain-containing protein